MPVSVDGGGQPIGFPAALYDLPESAWSAWTSWTAMDSLGRQAVIRDRVPSGVFEVAIVFALQARDDAGAITPKFDAATPNGNNYATLRVDGTLTGGAALRRSSPRDSRHDVVLRRHCSTGTHRVVGFRYADAVVGHAGNAALWRQPGRVALRLEHHRPGRRLAVVGVELRPERRTAAARRDAALLSPKSRLDRPSDDRGHRVHVHPALTERSK